MTDPNVYYFNARIYTEDTDAMGVVYHANYLYFFERARSEMLRSIGFTLSDMAVYDTYFVIYDVHIAYKYPARLDDAITIKTCCNRKKTCGLVFKQIMVSQMERLLSEATVQVVCVDKCLKPKKLPVNLL